MSMMTSSLSQTARHKTGDIGKDLSMVLNDVEEVTGISGADILSRSQRGVLTDARQLVYLCMRSRRHTFVSIAKAMNKLDHGTITKGCRRISDLAVVERKTAARIEAMRHKGYRV